MFGEGFHVWLASEEQALPLFHVFRSYLAGVVAPSRTDDRDRKKTTRVSSPRVLSQHQQEGLRNGLSFPLCFPLCLPSYLSLGVGVGVSPSLLFAPCLLPFATLVLTQHQHLGEEDTVR